ncbi:MAG: hypothetical protein LBC92_01635 [Rickettsiales bacterium]|jgi:hypothetical protein|nr:hypothetical protein [Rickettsiales bacterium]
MDRVKFDEINNLRGYKQVKEELLGYFLKHRDPSYESIAEIKSDGSIDFKAEVNQQNLNKYIDIIEYVRGGLVNYIIDNSNPEIKAAKDAEDAILRLVTSQEHRLSNTVAPTTLITSTPTSSVVIPETTPASTTLTHHKHRSKIKIGATPQKVHRAKLKVGIRDESQITQIPPANNSQPKEIDVIVLKELASSLGTMKRKGKDITPYIKGLIDDGQSEDKITDNIAAYIYKQAMDDKINSFSTKGNIKSLIERDGTNARKAGTHAITPLSADKQLKRAELVKQKLNEMLSNKNCTITEKNRNVAISNIDKLISSIESIQNQIVNTK